MDILAQWGLGSVRTILAFLLVLGVLVFIHELGHYLAARWRGIHVDRFSIGFGKKVASWTDRRGTEWQLAWLPLGGYVKLHGQESPADVTDEVRASWRDGETFHEKPVLDRAIVVAAGPAANFLLAALLFSALFIAMGRPVGTTTVGSVVQGGPAERAGVMVGDRILALDDTAVRRFEEVSSYVRARPGQPVQVRLLREGREVTVAVTPDPIADSSPPAGRVGIGGGAPAYEPADPFTAVIAGISYTADVTWQTLAGIGQMLTGQRGTEEIGGPLKIAQLSGQVAGMGIAALISFMAILSVNLALINLFPVPVLDGGHLVFYAIEAIRGRPLPPRAIEYGFRAGFALLIALFVFATWNDLASFGLFRWMAGAG